MKITIVNPCNERDEKIERWEGASEKVVAALAEAFRLSHTEEESRAGRRFRITSIVLAGHHIVATTATNLFAGD